MKTGITDKQIRGYLLMLNKKSIKYLFTYKYEIIVSYSLKYNRMCAGKKIAKFCDRKLDDETFFKRNIDIIKYIQEEMKLYKE